MFAWILSLHNTFSTSTFVTAMNEYLQMYNLNDVLLNSVLKGLTDQQVELPFKLSESEWDIITRSPEPPCSTILLGRSGTGKTTCALFKMWAKVGVGKMPASAAPAA